MSTFCVTRVPWSTLNGTFVFPTREQKTKSSKFSLCLDHESAMALGLSSCQAIVFDKQNKSLCCLVSLCVDHELAMALGLSSCVAIVFDTECR
jgi:hypothetical protein